MPQNYPHNRQNPGRKDESIRRANRVIQSRTFVLMLIMGIGMFIVLFFKLYSLQPADTQQRGNSQPRHDL